MNENKPDGKVIVLAGSTGHGKTTYARNLLASLKTSGKPVFISDIDGEYRDYYNQPYVSPKKFFPMVYKKENSIIVFEEAALTFKHFGDTDEILELLVAARRRKNIVVFNFHALRQIPVWVLIYTNWVVIKKTTVDNVDRFKDYPNIIEAYEQIRASNDRFATIEINLRAAVS